MRRKEEKKIIISLAVPNPTGNKECNICIIQKKCTQCILKK